MNSYTNCVVVWSRTNQQSGAAQHVITFGSPYPMAKKAKVTIGHDFTYYLGSLEAAQAALKAAREELGLQHQIERWTFAKFGGKRLWIGILAPLEVGQ